MKTKTKQGRTENSKREKVFARKQNKEKIHAGENRKEKKNWTKSSQVTVFRCCFPCRGGSTAPATSQTNSPNNENYSVLLQNDSHHHNKESQTDVDVSYAITKNLSPIESNQEQEIHQQTNQRELNDNDEDESYSMSHEQHQSQSYPQQPLCLPHIQEEEESDTLNQNSPNDDESTSVKERLINVTRSIRIVNPQRYIQSKQKSGSDDVNKSSSKSSSSPRSKRSQKSRFKSIISSKSSGNSGSTGSGSNTANNNNKASAKSDSEGGKSTTTDSSGTGNEDATTSGDNKRGVVYGSGANSSALIHSSATSGYLLPKMQAEQGSISELHKYHGRYLKNRRHTLANVRWVQNTMKTQFSVYFYVFDFLLTNWFHQNWKEIWKKNRCANENLMEQRERTENEKLFVRMSMCAFSDANSFDDFSFTSHRIAKIEFAYFVVWTRTEKKIQAAIKW